MRLLICLWCILAMCICLLYKTTLTTCLIAEDEDEPDSVEEMVRRGYSFQMSDQDWSILRENLQKSIDPIFREVIKRANDDKNLCEASSYIIGKKIAMIDEDISLEYQVNADCRKKGLISSENFNRLRLTKNNLFPGGYHAWCLHMGAPYRRRFSRVIGQLDDYGLMHHWYGPTFTFNMPRSRDGTVGKQESALDIETFCAALSVLLAGSVISFAVFVAEVFYSRMMK